MVKQKKRNTAGYTANNTKRLGGPLRQTMTMLKAVFGNISRGIGHAAAFVLHFLHTAADKARGSRALRLLSTHLSSARQTGISAFGRSARVNKPDTEPHADGAVRPLLRLRSATSRLRTTMRQHVYGREECLAKCVVSAAAVLMGFVLLLVFVYGIIPSLISDTAHFFEHDIAKEMYQHTLKDADIAALQQTPQQDLAFPRDSFTSVLEENPDIVGRLTISGIDLGYLVTQYKDNTRYTTTGYDRKESDSGAIFLDYRCNASLTPPKGHYILYGKNVSGGTMFGKLKSFRDQEFFYSKPSLRFDTLYADYEWEVFSVYVAAPDFDFEDTLFLTGNDWLEFLKLVQDKSLFPTDIQLTSDDTLLTLCTDSSDFAGARLVVHARLINH